MRVQRAAKRFLDIIAATTLLIALAPAGVVLGVALARSTGGSALLRQTRAGRNGHRFSIVKFRTMTDARDADGSLAPDSQRLTRLGRVVRTFGLDELPQLWNVLRGEMSLVGPRPLPAEYVELYTARERQRLMMSPGITGWAQVNGRHLITFTQRLELDAWYVENWSLLLDLKILFATLPRVARRKDVAVVQDLAAVDERGFHKLWDRG